MSWITGLKARLQLLVAGGAAESRADEEMLFHIDMEAERLMREDRLSPDHARRRALAAFGGVTQHKETLRNDRGYAWLSGFSLDMKLGVRMLRKYPGLTLVGGVAMAFAIWAGAVTFELVTLVVHPTLPFAGGDRIVRIQQWSLSTNDSEDPSLRDFIDWRRSLSSVNELGAYQDITANLIAPDGDARPVQVAAITASAFRIVPAVPLLGRVIVEADQRPGGPPVALLGFDVWRTRFGADPRVLGQTIQIGDSYATVVGVMPDGFAFPVSHELWTPLRPDEPGQAAPDQVGVTLFGRLAPGVSLDAAQAELTVVGRRDGAESPDPHERVQPRVMAYANLMERPAGTNLTLMFSIYLFALMLLVLVCSNVALLLFARAATREGELVVRSALGASRGRIVVQLFAEALVLGIVAAVVGLGAAALALRTWGIDFLTLNIGRLPFWYDPRLSPAAVFYALGLTVLGAVIAGVLPALKITRGLGSRLRQGTAGGGVHFGGIWTAVIVAQVAVTVAFPAMVLVEQRELRRIQTFDVGFSAKEYLGVHLEMDRSQGASGESEATAAAGGARYGRTLEEVRRRLRDEPGVGGVTFVDQLPRLFHTERQVEVDVPATPPHEVSTARIDLAYFTVLKTPLRAGRAFDTGDLAPDARTVIVDQAFVDLLLQGRNPIGQHMRFTARQPVDGTPEPGPEPWYEIVGVVNDLGMTYMAHQHRAAGVYLPTNLADAGPLYMVVQAQGDPMSLSQRVREITIAVDPTLRLTDLQRVDKVSDPLVWIIKLWLRITGLLTAIALLLSLAGIYAVLSFTVARRTREIGVRVALGASRRRLVVSIFRKPLIHVTQGVLAGGMLIVTFALLLSGGDGGLVRVEGGWSLLNMVRLGSYVVLMFAVCLLACIVPTRRALGVEPMEALRQE
jgi:predicted permease